VLRSVSAFEIYRKVYRDVITPSRVAELLMLRGDMPRSLLASMNEVCSTLDSDSQRPVRRDVAARRAAARRASIRPHRRHPGYGLHPFLTAFLKRVNDLGQRISQDFLVPPAVRLNLAKGSSSRAVRFNISDHNEH